MTPLLPVGLAPWPLTEKNRAFEVALFSHRVFDLSLRDAQGVNADMDAGQIYGEVEEIGYDLDPRL